MVILEQKTLCSTHEYTEYNPPQLFLWQILEPEITESIKSKLHTSFSKITNKHTQIRKHIFDTCEQKLSAREMEEKREQYLFYFDMETREAS